MYPIKKGILCFSLLTVMSVHSVQSQETNTWSDSQPATVPPRTTTVEAVNPAPSAQAPTVSSAPTATHQSTQNDEFLKMGIGIQTGIRFHNPDKFNDFVSDVWNSFLVDHVYTPVDKKNIGPGIFLTLNGTFDIGPYFQAAPFMQGMWAGKQFYFRGDIVKDLHINTYTALGGVNLWGRLKLDRYSVRIGAGIHGTHTIAKVTGDIDDAVFSGTGVGFRALIGSTMRLNDKFTLTLDGAFPFGGSDLVEGDVKTSSGNISYPERFSHSGFELCPGIMYYF